MSKKNKSSLLDNLWLWAFLAFGIMSIYGIWALFKTMAMHGANVIPHPP